MIELMAALREEGYRMALLSNNVREWERHWRAMAPIDEIFEVVVDSAFVGTASPSRRSTRCASRAWAGCGRRNASSSMTARTTARGAPAVGMTAVRYRSTNQAVGEIRAALSAGAVRSPG